jgi:hypothetical protein
LPTTKGQDEMRTNKQQARERELGKMKRKQEMKIPPPKEEDGKSNRGGTMESPERKQQNLKKIK